MKIRIGVGIAATSPAELAPTLDAVTQFGFDSIWLSEVLTGPSMDPLIAATWAAARHPRLKLGMTILLPGRNIVRLASQLASVDQLSAGRLLVTFVPGINAAPETDTIGVPQRERRAAIADGLPLLRRLLSGEPTSHEGPAGTFAEVALRPVPVQQPLEFWLGGTAPRSLELCGQLGDGWLPSLLTPEQGLAGMATIRSAAAAVGREVEDEHFGVSIAYSRTPVADAHLVRIAARAKGVDPRLLVPVGPDALRALLERFVDVGFSKFVVRPLGEQPSWADELGELARDVLHLQT